VEFDHAGTREAVGGEARPGDSLMDLADAWAAPIELSCRAANCAACVVEVIAGSHLLSPREPDELAVLDLFQASVTSRLACQARIAGTDGHVHLRVLGRTDRAPAPRVELDRPPVTGR
jgi:ferredoxin